MTVGTTQAHPTPTSRRSEKCDRASAPMQTSPRKMGLDKKIERDLAPASTSVPSASRLSTATSIPGSMCVVMAVQRWYHATVEVLT